jgi:AmmeMemoRadiSam system protein B/AmmeMemoRadiSam system protein A
METMNEISLQFAEFNGDPAELGTRVDRYLRSADQPPLPVAPVAVIVPHAGYVYSGPVAAHAYRALRGMDFDTVVVVGPSHRSAFRGISVMDAETFRTPLGDIPVDSALVRELLRGPDTSWRPEAHAREHSLEVQVPFLQRALGKFSLVLAVVGNLSPAAEKAFIETLARARGSKRILLVASTDLSHYHDYKTARKLDDVALGLVRSLDAAALLRAVEKEECELCGILPVHLAMEYARVVGAGDVRLLDTASSGDTAGPKDQVVGYASLAFLPGAAAKAAATPAEAAGSLGPAEKKRLLDLARRTIESWVRDRKLPAVSETDPTLQVRQGAFVTIEMKGALRGCIGNFVSKEPLWKTVMAMAVAASSEDPRFPPMTPADLPGMELEISVLSPMRRISGPSEIEVGKHGLYIVKGYRSGTLLPQVATDYGWDGLTFLQQTCRKAGLPPDAWKEGAEISVYDAQVFSEKHP